MKQATANALWRGRLAESGKSTTRFVVIAEHRERTETRVYGPYRTMKAAEGDAKAWDAHPWATQVVPLFGAGAFDFKA